MLIIGSAPVNFFYFIFLLKTKESASLAWLFLHTGRWPACIESVFYWICGSRIFSLETLPNSAQYSPNVPGYWAPLGEYWALLGEYWALLGEYWALLGEGF